MTVHRSNSRREFSRRPSKDDAWQDSRELKRRSSKDLDGWQDSREMPRRPSKDADGWQNSRRLNRRPSKDADAWHDARGDMSRRSSKDSVDSRAPLRGAVDSRRSSRSVVYPHDLQAVLMDSTESRR